MDDDEIRSRLRREHMRATDDLGTAAAFTALLPSMRAARRRRMTVITLSVAMTIGGVAASAAAIRSIDSDPSVIVEGTSPPDGPTLTGPDDDSDGAAPPTTRPRPADDDVAATTPPVTTAEAVTSSVVVDVTIPGNDTEPADTTAAPAPTQTAPVSTIGSPATTPPSTSTTTTTTTTTTVAATTTTTTTEPDDDEPDDDDGDGESDDGHSSTFECACGSVVVDPNTGELDVRPDAGYTYRLEDVERHDDGTRTQTVQFTGIGEDCELVVSLP